MSQSTQISATQNAVDAGIYKSQLQQFCQRRSWRLPEYKTLQEGSCHCPHFKASVLVNGLTFETSEFFKRAKDAQIEAAKLALAHFSYVAPPPPGGIGGASSLVTNGKKRPMTDEMSVTMEEQAEKTSDTKRYKHSGADLHLYKNQLQSVAVKKGYDLPIYTFVREGPPHNSRFKSKVNVNGQTYESPNCFAFATLKDSEHAAAKAALLALVPTESQDAILDKSVFKNLLQELTQKSGLKIPVYNTVGSGASHAPIFVSNVVVNGETFYGQEAKSKKLAEMNAAEFALVCLSRREVQGPSGSTPVCVSNGVSGSNLQALDAPDLGPANQLGAPSKVVTNQSDSELPTSGDQNSLKEIPSCAGISTNYLFGSPTVGITTTVPPSPHASLDEPLEYIPLSQDDCPSQKTSVHGSVPVSIPADIFSDSSSSLRNVVRVYPRVLNIDLPPRAVVQHSDDKWISVRIPANQTGQ